MALDRAIQHQISNSDFLEQQWLRKDTSDNSEDTITSRFDRQVAAVPDKLAIVTDETSLTYRALDLQANRIAAALASLPSQRDRPIALFMKDEAARIATMLGALKANRIFIPLASDSPEKWVTRIIEDSGTAQIIVDSSTRSIAELAAIDSVTVMEVEQLARSSQPFVADWIASPDDTVYVIYTSGSTGRPKGVASSHRRFIGSSDARKLLTGLGRSDRYANLRSSGVSSWIRNTLSPLLSGACLLPFNVRRHGLQKLAAWFIAQEITYVAFSGSLLRTWLASLPNYLQVPTLRFVEVTGERLYAEDVIRVTRHLEGDWRIGHTYSSTECGVIATDVFTPSRLPVPGIVAVGRPVDGMEVCVKDETGALVSPGEIGEIVVRSRFLAQGYWKNPELTAKVFQTDPFNSAIRTYHTGDLGRWRSDGTLEHMGRKGRGIRLRGYSVEPFEVECELMREPGVTDALVFLHDGAAGQEPCLVGYVVAHPNASASDLRNGLAERLPSYMVPSHIIVLDSFPIASSGKIDRNALPPPEGRSPELDGSYVAPRTPTEEALASIWREVLNLEQVGVHDNFFELGGHSLLAIQVVARLARLLKLDLPLHRFFETATISALAAELQKMLGAGETGDVRSMVPLPRTDNLPLSFAQQRLWFLDRLLPNKAAYNILRIWQLRGRLDALALERSLNEVVARHETLRTRFILSGDAPVQVIEPPSAVTLPITDLSPMPELEREARVRQITDTEAHQPFDLEAGPLLRTQLLRLAAEEHLLVFNVHHIASDGWSMGVLCRELSSGYNAFVSGHAPDLPRLPLQYVDYAVWQREWLRGETLEGQLAYWKKKLADLSALDLPTDRPRPPVPSHQGANLIFDLPAPVTQALKELSRREGATLFMTLFTAFQVLLHHYSAQEDIAVGTPIAGRGRTEHEGLIGFFVNTLVLRSNLAGNPAFSELLAQVRETALGAYTHQDLPFEKLVEELSHSRDISRNPLFQVMFVLQNAPDAKLLLRGVQASRVPLAGHSAKFDLTVTMGETTAGLQSRWEYSTDLFDASTIEHMAHHFNMLLEGIVRDADQRIWQLLQQTDAKRYQLPAERIQTELKREASLEDSYPLSSLQHGMLFHALWEKGTGVYIVQILIELHETLDEEKFKRAWSRITSRHPILRTSFCWEGLNEPQQQVHAKVELPWKEEDLRAFTDADGEKWLANFLAADRRQGFDMTHAPLFRLTLLRCGEADYRFVWTYHHIILDGASRRLLQREVFAYYEAFLRDGDITRPQPRPYRDYIDWLQQQDFSQDEPFWRERLNGFAAPTRLSVDHVPEPIGGDVNRAGIRDTKLPTEITSALRSMAEKYGLTFATIIHGAWAILLSRYSGETDVVFGVVRSNRRGTVEGADDVIGLCMNTLPMRLNVNSERMLPSWLRDVSAQWIAIRHHAHTPLVKVQGWSEVPGGHPLFASIVNFIADAQSRMQGAVGPARRVRMIEQTNYPVSLSVYDGAELRLEIFFDRSRIDDDAAERMLGHLWTMLEGMATEPERKVSELPLLTSPERHQLLVEWNQTEVDYPRDKCVHQLFQVQVQRTPDAVAVVFDDQCITYAQLNAQSNQLARYLQRHGIRRGSLVALHMERSSDLIVTLLAILKSGGAYLVVETDIPSRRLNSILEEARPAAIVAKSQREKVAINLIESVEGVKIASLPIVFCLDQDVKSISDESTENLNTDTTSEDQAYVCFTSGSSGQPKGVSIRHRAIVRLVKATNYVSLSESDVFLQCAPPSFDASTFEIWGCLLNGGRLVVLSSEKLSLAHLGSAIRKNKPSVLWLTAGLFHHMVDHELDSLSGVRQLLAGGDVLSIAQVRKALERLGEGRLINGYGPTENTTFTCCYSITQLSAEEHSVPIGRPISNTQCFILDCNLRPVPIGVRGELFAGGDGLARGYLNDPKLTAEKFIPNPFRLGSLLYRTGDFARYRSDGNIEFLGRIDNQVKIRGYRIELGEIESVLKRHPMVSEAVVVAREDVSGDRRLVAHVAPASAADKAGELRGFMKERLQAYMLPSAFVFTDTFPLMPNGKLDRTALPAPERRSPDLDSSYVAPRTPTEEALASIWCEILNLKRVGVHDNFFELGGHSLLAVQLRFQIQRTLKIEVPLVAIYRSPTIDEIALSILQQQLEALGPKEAEGLLAEMEGVLDD
jgi:amino acid adenylation domain-containing protein